MACGILLITHPGIGSALLRVARHLLKQIPLNVEVFEVAFDADLAKLSQHALAVAKRLNQGDGVLVLTDLYGASPSNLARLVANRGVPIQRVSALNLPMLLRVLNYPEQILQELSAIAAAGACKGAIIDDA